MRRDSSLGRRRSISNRSRSSRSGRSSLQVDDDVEYDNNYDPQEDDNKMMTNDDATEHRSKSKLSPDRYDDVQFKKHTDRTELDLELSQQRAPCQDLDTISL